MGMLEKTEQQHSRCGFVRVQPDITGNRGEETNPSHPSHPYSKDTSPVTGTCRRNVSVLCEKHRSADKTNCCCAMLKALVPKGQL